MSEPIHPDEILFLGTIEHKQSSLKHAILNAHVFGVKRRSAVKKRFAIILMFVFSIWLANCAIPTSEPDLDAIVAGTLQALEAMETLVPGDTPVPTATMPASIESPTPTPTHTTEPEAMTDAEQIKAALIEYVDVDMDESTITVSEIEGKLARGGLQGAYFIAAKEAGSWIIIYAGQATPYCNLINPYAFPTAWVPECLAPDDSLVVREEPEVHPDLASLGSPTWTDTMDTQGRWYLLSTENTEFSIESGYLVMNALDAGGYDEWGVAAGTDQTDFYLELTAKTGDFCSGLDRYGVIFRVPDPTKGYIVEFSCNGRFRLYQWDGENYTGLQNWKLDSAILAGPDKENRLGVMVVGEQVKLYANNQSLGEYTLEHYPQGRFGLVVGSIETDNFKVMVDTVKFWKLAGD
jgi:hypothetical protein